MKKTTYTEKNKNKPVSPCLFCTFKTDPFFQDWFQSVQGLWGLLWSSSLHFLGLICFLFFSDTSAPAVAASSLLLDAFLCLVFLLASGAQLLLRDSHLPFLLGDQPHPNMPLLTDCSTQSEKKGNTYL